MLYRREEKGYSKYFEGTADRGFSRMQRNDENASSRF